MLCCNSFQLISNWLIPDHEADAFVSPPNPELAVGIGDTVVEGLFGGLVRWDAQYFVHIAEYGYTHENTLAFFPLYPLLVRLIGNILHIPLQLFLNYHSTIILSAVLLNFYLFIKTAEIFYRLSREVLRDEVLAYRAAILFCFNPASIFFSAPYSETVFAFCTFSALLNYEHGGGWSAPAHFGLAGAARSNGIVNIGFVLYHKLHHCATYYYRLVKLAKMLKIYPISLIIIMYLCHRKYLAHAQTAPPKSTLLFGNCTFNSIDNFFYSYSVIHLTSHTQQHNTF